MYLEGSIEGCGYGDLSPLDYRGLKLWLRATDGVTFQRGNTVGTWRDLSSGILFTGTGPNGDDRTGAGGIYQTPYGLGYAAFSADSSLKAKSNIQNFNFLINGSPYTVYAIFNVINADGTGNTTLLRQIPANQYAAYSLFQGAAIASRHLNGDGNSMYSLDIQTQNGVNPISVGQNVIYTETNYGYGSGQIPLAFNTLDGFTQRTKINNYLIAPDPNSVYTAPFGVTPNSKRYLYEVIIYDHTGKSKATIDLETTNLVNNYIKKRYPDF